MVMTAGNWFQADLYSSDSGPEESPCCSSRNFLRTRMSACCFVINTPFRLKVVASIRAGLAAKGGVPAPRPAKIAFSITARRFMEYQRSGTGCEDVYLALVGSATEPHVDRIISGWEL